MQIAGVNGREKHSYQCLSGTGNGIGKVAHCEDFTGLARLVKDHRLHEAALVSKASIFASKSRATFNASEFVYGARRLAIRSYDKWTPS